MKNSFLFAGDKAAEFGFHLYGFKNGSAPSRARKTHHLGDLLMRKFSQEIIESQKLVGIKAFDQVVKSHPKFKLLY
jgi:hypothetical protein